MLMEKNITSKREITTAQNKQTLLLALLVRMGSERFEEIKITSLCKDVSLSEASFYNYFPQKTDILVYFIQLWSIEIAWKLKYEYTFSGLEAIERLFKETARSTVEHPTQLAEIIAFLARLETVEEWPQISTADKLVAYPEYEGVENIVDEGLDRLLIPDLESAVKQGELPPQTPVKIIALAVASLFFGVPMFVTRQAPVHNLEEIFNEQLQLIWNGARKQYH